ncbi:hypothetical protein C8R45DRAFT_399959 [Mycena sanguinolenta]|nr:hypothetical protein C8R45DRAFT_399959 [Mycena sanguinolenta]
MYGVAGEVAPLSAWLVSIYTAALGTAYRVTAEDEHHADDISVVHKIPALRWVHGERMGIIRTTSLLRCTRRGLFVPDKRGADRDYDT